MRVTNSREKREVQEPALIGALNAVRCQGGQKLDDGRRRRALHQPLGITAGEAAGCDVSPGVGHHADEYISVVHVYRSDRDADIGRKIFTGKIRQNYRTVLIDRGSVVTKVDGT